MKKIRLNVADLDATEILSRDQLKAIFGGSTGSSGSDSTNASGSGCSGKSDGDSCTNSEGKSGTCKSVPFSGLVCWRN